MIAIVERGWGVGIGVGENKPGMEGRGGGYNTMWEVKGGRGREGKGMSQQTGSKYGKGNGIPVTGRKLL